MRIATVVGNRPQFIKAAAVSRLLRRGGQEILIDTGQHYDDELSGVFFRELELPAVDHQLGLGASGLSDAEQTARMLGVLAPLLASLAPDAVLVYGDTNSTLAAALAGAQSGLPVAHVEAGMRSFDRRMPEELNRVLTDHLADLLLCSTPVAVENLRREGVLEGVREVGDVMVDVALMMSTAADGPDSILDRLDLQAGEFLLATAHRAGNVDDPERLLRLVELLVGVPGPVVMPLHPRTRARLHAAGLYERLSRGVTLLEPLGYLEFTALLRHARAVLTDSGGVQKEAYLARCPCITLRESTEWTETVRSGWNVLVGLDPTAARAALARTPPAEHPPLYGDGRAGVRVVQALEELVAAAPHRSPGHIPRRCVVSQS